MHDGDLGLLRLGQALDALGRVVADEPVVLIPNVLHLLGNAVNQERG